VRNTVHCEWIHRGLHCVALWIHWECFHCRLLELSLWTAQFDRCVVGLGGRGPSLETSPLGLLPPTLSMPGLEAGGRPGRQARCHLVLGLPSLGRWGRPRAHVALWLPHPQASRPRAAWRVISFLLGAVQALHGAWAAYTFSIIVLKIFFFLV
jgi:hypothetical protein